MPSYERILVALDFSRCAQDVAAHALEVARAFGATVHLLHVDALPDGVPAEARLEVAPGDIEAAGEWMARRALVRLRETFEPIFERRGVSVTSSVVTGPVGPRIVESITGLRADLVIMGTHGRTGVARLMLGSIAEEVIRRAPVPVMTVRTHYQPDCAAANCAWCASDRTDDDVQLDAETMG